MRKLQAVARPIQPLWATHRTIPWSLCIESYDSAGILLKFCSNFVTKSESTLQPKVPFGGTYAACSMCRKQTCTIGHRIDPYETPRGAFIISGAYNRPAP